MFCIDDSRLNIYKKRVGIEIFILIVLLMFIIYSYINNIESSQYNRLRALGFIGWGTLIVFFTIYKKITNVLITPITIFVLSMFSFSYGQILLFCLGVEYDYFFYNNYYSLIYNNNLNTLVLSNLYILVCLCIFCLGVLVSINFGVRRTSKKNIIFNTSMRNAFFILFFISAIPYLIYNVYLVFYSLSYGYSQSLTLTQPAIIRYIGVFFIPSSLGVIISCDKKDNLIKGLVIFCDIANCICAFIIGGRSLAVGLIVGLVIILVMNKKISGWSVLLLCIGGFALATISVSVADYRNAANESLYSIFLNNLTHKNIFIQFLGESGFSGSSMVWTMQLVQSGYETFNGMTYIGAVLGLIPSSIDIFNILKPFEYCTQLEGLLTNYFSFNFGVGFSLIAESYINFKWSGCIIMFFEAIIFSKIFNFQKHSSPWEKYIAISMLTVLLSIPRRDIVFLSDQFTLCVIIPYMFIKFMQSLSRKTIYFYTCKEN